METFRTIKVCDGKPKSSALAGTYKTLEDLGNRFVIRRENDNSFCVFPEYAAYAKWLESVPAAERCFHEVIFGGQPQKIKIDIDGKAADLDDIHVDGLSNTPDTREQKFCAVLQSILDGAVFGFMGLYNVQLDPSDLLVYRSRAPAGSPQTEDKFSAHIVVNNYYAADNAQAAVFTKYLIRTINNPHISHFIDKGTNSSTQNFRLPLAVKHKSARVKTFEDHSAMGAAKTEPFAGGIITQVASCKCLPLQAVKLADPARPDEGENTASEDAVLAIVERSGLTADHEFRARNGNWFYYNRLNASECELCNKMHERDNTLCVFINNINEVRYSCFKLGKDVQRNSRSILLGHIRPAEGGVTAVAVSADEKAAGGQNGAPQTGRTPDQAGGKATILTRGLGTANGGQVAAPTTKPPNATQTADEDAEAEAEAALRVQMEPWVERTITGAIANRGTKPGSPLSSSKFHLLPAGQKEVYCEPALRPFQLVPTLCVEAPMKIGKTKELRRFVDRAFPVPEPGALEAPIIRILSFRCTFSANMREKFPDFDLYSDEQGEITSARAIIQVESLHRLIVDAEPDLLILDECESILEQFDSGLSKDATNVFAKFQWLMKYSKHVVCMDANLSDRTYEVVSRMRAGLPINYHNCTHKNGAADKYVITGDQGKWLALLFTRLDQGKRVVIPTSAKRDADALLVTIKERYPEKEVKLYSSATGAGERKTHFANVDEQWSNYDVLIYSPTISAGISFELKHFDCIFGAFYDGSCAVETCHQMIGRIRNVSDHEFCIFLSAIGADLPFTVSGIREAVRANRISVMSQFTDHTMYRIGRRGDIEFYDSDYFTLWLNNTRIRNLSKNFFVARFTDYVFARGSLVEQLTDEAFERMASSECAENVQSFAEHHKETRKAIKEKQADNVASAEEITGEDAADFEQVLFENKDLTPEQADSYEKYRLRQYYRFRGVIGARFVTTYSARTAKRTYKNLYRLGGRTAAEALPEIQRVERDEYVRALELSEEIGDRALQPDINRKYVFNQHRIALALLGNLGWSGPRDPVVRHSNSIFTNITLHQDELLKLLGEASVELGLRISKIYPTTARAAAQGEKEEYILLFAKPIRQVIASVYGTTIRYKKKAEIWELAPSNLFDYGDPTDITARKPRIPLIVAAPEDEEGQ